MLRYIMVVTEYTTKYAEAFAIENKKQETIASILFKKIICR